MIEGALEWNGYFIYKNPDGDEVMLFTTNPDVDSLTSASAVWLRKRDQSAEQSKLQVQGFAAAVISLAINHYWTIHNYDKYSRPMGGPANLEDLD